MHKMPKEIEFVADKILANKNLYDEIKKMLIAVVSKLNNDSLGHSSFCNALRTPNGIDKKLLKIFGISDRQMISSFTEIGFHPDSRMYSSLYYQTLSLVYYIGVRAKDDVLRQFAVALIYVKVFNGRQYKYMPNGCQEEIAQYLIQSVFRNSHTFKKYPNPFNAIANYFAPTLDNKYFPYVEKDPAHPTMGLVVILMQSWGRMDQIFRGVKDHYYEAHNNGNRSIMSSGSEGNGREVSEIDATKVTTLVDKLQKNLINHQLKLTDKDRKYLKAEPFAVSDKFLDGVKTFLDDYKNEDDLKNIYELLFSITKTEESKMCGLNVVQTVSKITSSKGTDTKVQNLKSYTDKMLERMYKGLMKTGSSSNKLKLRKVLLLIITLRGKGAFCKAEFEK